MSALLLFADMAVGAKLSQCRNLSISAPCRLQHSRQADSSYSSEQSHREPPLKIRMGILSEPERRKVPSNKAGSDFLRRLGKAMAARPLQETVEELAAGIVYTEDDAGSGLVVLNKPYGLPVNKAEDSPVSLSACLPALAQRLGSGKN